MGDPGSDVINHGERHGTVQAGVAAFAPPTELVSMNDEAQMSGRGNRGSYQGTRKRAHGGGKGLKSRGNFESSGTN